MVGVLYSVFFLRTRWNVRISNFFEIFRAWYIWKEGIAVEGTVYLGKVNTIAQIGIDEMIIDLGASNHPTDFNVCFA